VFQAMGLCKVIASMPEFSLSCSGAHGGMARQRRLIWHPALDNGFHKSMGSKCPPKINRDLLLYAVSHLRDYPKIQAEYAPALGRHVEIEVVVGIRCRRMKPVYDIPDTSYRNIYLRYL
jgi:hypothetical protein